MRTLDLTTKAGRKDLLMKQASSSDTMRDLAHDLINQLTVIDLSVFHLRTVLASDASAAQRDLAQLATVIEKALSTGKRLSLEINSSAAVHREQNFRLTLAPLGLTNLSSSNSDRPVKGPKVS
jgi:hypothetical protein